MKQMVVTAAIIIKEGKILLAQRNPGSYHELLWEFPGGKLEANEGPITGLQREIKEELDLDITVGDIFQVEWHQNVEHEILLLFYLCQYQGGVAKPLDCHDYQWVGWEQLLEYDYPPADQAVVKKLQEKFRYLDPVKGRFLDRGRLCFTDRSQRKVEHIQQFLGLVGEEKFYELTPKNTNLADIQFVHLALPELNWEDIDLSWEAFGKRANVPLIINAITGGTQEVAWINRALARCARSTGVAIAVGSQTAALLDPLLSPTFRIVREENPTGIVIANVSASTPAEQAAKAVEMLQADALQVHLNVPQELAMAEGERSFRGWRQNIADMVQYLTVPVIVKEVGFGLSMEVIRDLKSLGVCNFDIGGFGGTNFIAIEENRRGACFSGLQNWGIPTAAATIEAYHEGIPGELFAAGGINNPLDGVKALALGATAIGVAGHFLQTLCQQSEENLLHLIEHWKHEMQKIYLMCGARNTAELHQVPLVITGVTKEWLEQRQISTTAYACRSK